MSAQGIHHVAITTAHLQDTLRLYRQGLGFEVKHIWGHEQKVYMLDAGGGACVELFEGYTGELDAPGAPRQSGEWMHLALRTGDIAASWQRALDAGAKPKLPPTYANIMEAQPRPVDMYFAYLTGYDGEEIEFIQELDGPVEE